MNPDDLILIALLPQPADLARAQAGWYRVPLARAPDALWQARALALYQPASFGAARWQIAWWGRINSLEQRRRRELIPEEPDHRRADDAYLVARLAPLQPVEPVKRSEKGRRLLFVPATWQSFQAAATIDELVARAPRAVADDPLYRLIKQQVEDATGIPDPRSTYQRRLFEMACAFPALDW